MAQTADYNAADVRALRSRLAVNAVVFYILAVLIVGTSAVVVGAPRMREAGYALVATALFIAILAGATGARIVAAVQFLVPVAGVAAVLWLLRRRVYRGMARPDRLTSVIAARGAVAVGFVALLITAFAASAAGWHVGYGTASLITVLHYRAPYALVIAVILAVAGAGIALMVGRTAGDERETDEALAARRRREERMRRRREDRETARRRRAVPPAESRA